MDWIAFPIFLATCAAAGATGIIFKPGTWYAQLSKPPWTPPNKLFPIAWSVIYVLMAAAAARIAARDGIGVPLALWSLQIALNTLWTPVFFGNRMIRAGAAVIGCLGLAITATMVAFWQIDTLAGVLLLPYLLWVLYAGSLNVAIWQRNPHATGLRPSERSS
ncbi:tryptophan-rich sensory protein [Mesobaculum littorinae]|uniref:Tryptophan-rich sensory protein n=1 Tax=Mesobaculum littorinae TaxID=2486419 RepID=A0A438AHA4_9RHOB|nr:TspO/MBR family protein [Mesobaculum littorinae]RVV98109.1 tryptophan-rich sensory protein [Mesobaculum littorinae]